MKVTIEIEPYPEATDPDHATGLTSDAYDELLDALSEIGDVLDIRAG